MSAIIQQSGDLLQVFQNALAYTVALSALQQSAEDNSDFFIVSLSVSIIVGLLAFARNQLKVLSVDSDVELVHGLIQCSRFLLNLACNIFTQFLSTLVARYVITFVPTLSDPLTNVLPTLLITLSLLWALLYSLGITEQ